MTPVSQATSFIKEVLEALDVLQALAPLAEPEICAGEHVVYVGGPYWRVAEVVAVLDLPWGRLYEIAYYSVSGAGPHTARVPRSALKPFAERPITKSMSAKKNLPWNVCLGTCLGEAACLRLADMPAVPAITAGGTGPVRAPRR